MEVPNGINFAIAGEVQISPHVSIHLFATMETYLPFFVFMYARLGNIWQAVTPLYNTH
jgi:hypothetical protein